MANKLEKARQIINEVDTQMAELFVKRMRAAELVYEHKKEYGLPILDQNREDQVIASNSARIEDDVLKGYYNDYLKNLMSLSRAYQYRMQSGLKVAYSGVEGAFAHIAAGRILSDSTRVSCRDFKSAYKDYFRQISEGTPTLDISDCPDLGPILFALAAMKNGAVFTGTERLKAKESDRGMAMHEELQKLGGGLIFGDNTITVPRQRLQYHDTVLNGHNDHRIVMVLSVILSQIGGSIEGAEAIRKSYPGFFRDIEMLGAEVTAYGM